MKDDVVGIIDLMGRCILGRQTEHSGESDILTIHDPLILAEIVDPREKKVHLIINPLFHNFDIQTIKSKWSHKLELTDKMIELYNQHMIQLRASRSGIQVVKSMPNKIQVGT